jgi:hypothetical protein
MYTNCGILTLPGLPTPSGPMSPAEWNGQPERLPDAFRLTKTTGYSRLTAVCEVRTHERGLELRLVIEGQGLQVSSVARTADEMRATTDTWRHAMLEQGWTEE